MKQRDLFEDERPEILRCLPEEVRRQIKELLAELALRHARVLRKEMRNER